MLCTDPWKQGVPNRTKTPTGIEQGAKSDPGEPARPSEETRFTSPTGLPQRATGFRWWHSDRLVICCFQTPHERPMRLREWGFGTAIGLIDLQQNSTMPLYGCVEPCAPPRKPGIELPPQAAPSIDHSTRPTLSERRAAWDCGKFFSTPNVVEKFRDQSLRRNDLRRQLGNFGGERATRPAPGFPTRRPHTNVRKPLISLWLRRFPVVDQGRCWCRPTFSTTAAAQRPTCPNPGSPARVCSAASPEATEKCQDPDIKKVPDTFFRPELIPASQCTDVIMVGLFCAIFLPSGGSVLHDHFQKCCSRCWRSGMSAGA